MNIHDVSSASQALSEDTQMRGGIILRNTPWLFAAQKKLSGLSYFRKCRLVDSKDTQKYVNKHRVSFPNMSPLICIPCVTSAT